MPKSEITIIHHYFKSLMNQIKSAWLENFFIFCNIITSWKELQIGNDLCDVTLACEDNQMKALKIIISSYSLLGLDTDILQNYLTLFSKVKMRRKMFKSHIEMKHLVNPISQKEHLFYILVFHLYFRIFTRDV